MAHDAFHLACHAFQVAAGAFRVTHGVSTVMRRGTGPDRARPGRSAVLRGGSGRLRRLGEAAPRAPCAALPASDCRPDTFRPQGGLKPAAMSAHVAMLGNPSHPSRRPRHWTRRMAGMSPPCGADQRCTATDPDDVRPGAAARRPLARSCGKPSGLSACIFPGEVRKGLPVETVHTARCPHPKRPIPVFQNTLDIGIAETVSVRITGE